MRRATVESQLKFDALDDIILRQAKMLYGKIRQAIKLQIQSKLKVVSVFYLLDACSPPPKFALSAKLSVLCKKMYKNGRKIIAVSRCTTLESPREHQH